MHKLRIGLGLIASLWAISAMPTLAAAPPALRESVAVCDPNSPQHCAAPNASGAIPITGSITADNASVGANNATAPASSTEIGTIDGTGKLQGISSTNPIPITGSISVVNNSVGATGAAVPSSITYLGGNNGGNSIGITLNSSGQPTIANTAFTVNAGTNLNTSALALSASQTNGNQKTQIVDGSGNVIASTSNNLNVQCANCSGSGASAADQASFTAGVSVFAPSGGFFQTTATSNPLTTGQQGLVQLTVNRAFHTNLRNASGVEVGTSTTPLQVTLANTGANATALLVTGTGGTFPVTGTFWQATQPVSGTFWQATQPVSGTVTANIGTSGSLALDASVTGLQVSQGSTTSGQKGGLGLGAVTTAAPSYTTAQSSPLSLTTAGALRVDASGSTQPVSGTIAATQSGTWTVQPGNTPNTTAWKVDGSAVTQPVSGTITANAGTNLNTSALALDTSVNGLLLSQGSSTSGQKGTLAVGAVTTGAPTYTTTQTSPLSLTTAGALRVDASGSTQPVSGTVTANAGTNLNTSLLALESGGNLATLAGGVSSSVFQENLKQVNGVTTLAGAGAVGTGAQRVAIGTDSGTIAGSAPGTAGTASSNVVTVQGITSMTAIKVDGSGVTQPVSGTVTANIGTSGSLALDTSVGTTNTDIGPPGATSCATDTGSCSINALVQRNNQRLTTINNILAAGINIGSVSALPAIVQGDSSQTNAIRGAITSAMTGTTSTQLLAAPGGGKFNYITSLSCVNSHATVGTNVIIQDGSGGTTILNLAAGSAFGGTARTFPYPGLKQPTINTALYAADVTTGASVTCDAEGYTGS